MSTQLTAHRIPTAGVDLEADVHLPDDPRGAVLFAHGSGSSRRSPRNRAVADVLHDRGFGTVLVDLLTEDEERIDAMSRELRFDIGLLAVRLTGILDWLHARPDTQHTPLGLFGASTGAAAALVSAAARPDLVGAVVSRGGRPDLADSALTAVQAPTLLIVGSHDETVIELNQQARTAMTAPNELLLIPGATHLFGEPGALEQVADHAADWFSTHLTT
ncbi:dienelactone hydrolase family protein [Cryptosporangium aurantiacum]|uniref:Dienelactone hydrolase n=1 Tax=Cryptosporangium aurantiacum TaxID=134849 RepID=A0A1M7TUL7_9ACTN|nr:dienelactone hydrolase family protein [Cryptosporangium aurantiacum]SHN74434.1 Dienelactone hydrolase [Cryptosporangium aurantiacum]